MGCARRHGKPEIWLTDAKTSIDAFKPLFRDRFLLPSERGSIPCALDYAGGDELIVDQSGTKGLAAPRPQWVEVFSVAPHLDRPRKRAMFVLTLVPPMKTTLYGDCVMAGNVRRN